MQKWLSSLILALHAIAATSCGPTYPDDENHRGASNSDCIDCHVRGDHLDAPEPTGKHFDGKKLDWDNCKHCHKKD